MYMCGCMYNTYMYNVVVNVEISQLLLCMKVLFVDNLITRNLLVSPHCVMLELVGL